MSNEKTAPKIHRWQRKASITASAIIGTLALIAVLIFVAYTYHWSLITTTSTTEVTQSPQKKVTTTETGKTLLDWLQLVGVLAIPIVVAVGTAVFTTRQTRISEANRKQQHDTEMQIAENQQQEELLRTYFDKISDLLLDEEQSSNPKVQSIVRARTLAALHILNTERKTIVLRFLHDSDFLQHVKSFFYMLDLSHTDLNRMNLSEANLSQANLQGANLSQADLSGANLPVANLSQANLQGANLQGAGIDEYQLKDARNITPEQLSLIISPEQKILDILTERPEQEVLDQRVIDYTAERLERIRTLRPEAPQEAKTVQLSATPDPSETKPDQTSQVEAEQQEHTQPKQDIDSMH